LLKQPNVTNPRISNLTSGFTPDTPYANDADGSGHDLELVTKDYEMNVVPDMVRRVHLKYVLSGLDVNAPFVVAAYATGPEVLQGSQALWDVMLWDSDSWAGTVGGEYVALDGGDAPRDDGRRSWTWDVGVHTKTIRYRFRSTGAPSTLTIRGITTVHRQNRSAV